MTFTSKKQLIGAPDSITRAGGHWCSLRHRTMLYMSHVFSWAGCGRLGRCSAEIMLSLFKCGSPEVIPPSSVFSQGWVKGPQISVLEPGGGSLNQDRSSLHKEPGRFSGTTERRSEGCVTAAYAVLHNTRAVRIWRWAEGCRQGVTEGTKRGRGEVAGSRVVVGGNSAVETELVWSARSTRVALLLGQIHFSCLGEPLTLPELCSSPTEWAAPTCTCQSCGKRFNVHMPDAPCVRTCTCRSGANPSLKGGSPRGAPAPAVCSEPLHGAGAKLPPYPNILRDTSALTHLFAFYFSPSLVLTPGGPTGSILPHVVQLAGRGSLEAKAWASGRWRPRGAFLAAGSTKPQFLLVNSRGRQAPFPHGGPACTQGSGASEQKKIPYQASRPTPSFYTRGDRLGVGKWLIRPRFKWPKSFSARQNWPCVLVMVPKSWPLLLLFTLKLKILW